jgi:hypothetical protein
MVHKSEREIAPLVACGTPLPRAMRLARLLVPGDWHVAMLAWLALITQAQHSVETDAQGRPRLRRSFSLVAAHIGR